MSDHYVLKLRQHFVEDMQIKGQQFKTQTMYLRAMRDFSPFWVRAPDSATPEELRAFHLDMKERGVGAPTFNNRLTVLSFFYATTCPRPEMKQHMRYQWTPKKIPVVLSAEEVARILEAAPGPGSRYRAAFSVAYGGGLRANEVTHLKDGEDRIAEYTFKRAARLTAVGFHLSDLGLDGAVPPQQSLQVWRQAPAGAADQHYRRRDTVAAIALAK